MKGLEKEKLLFALTRERRLDTLLGVQSGRQEQETEKQTGSLDNLLLLLPWAFFNVRAKQRLLRGEILLTVD